MSDEPKDSFDDVKDLVKETDAVRVQIEGIPLLDRETLITNWPDIAEGHLQRAKKYLSLFTSSKNAEPQAWVDAPLADREEFPGKWRLAGIAVSKQTQGIRGIIRTLKLGWAETLIWNEAFVMESDTLTNEERYMSIVFRGINPAKLRSLTETLIAGNVVADPTIQDESYPGTWYILHAKPILEPDDGSGTITVLLAKPQFTVLTYENRGAPNEHIVYNLFNVPKSIVQSTIDGYNTFYGATAYVTYNTNQGVCDVKITRRLNLTYISVRNVKTTDSCMVEEFTDDYYGLTQTQYEAFSMGTRTQGWIFEIINHSMDSDGLWNLTVRRTHSIAVTIPEEIVDIQAGALVRRQVEKNTTTNAPVTDPGQGIRARKELSVNRDCTFDKIIDKLESRPQEIPEHISRQTYNAVDHTYMKRNQRIAALPDAEAVVAGQQTFVDGEIDEDGSLHFRHRRIQKRDISIVQTYDSYDSLLHHETSAEKLGQTPSHIVLSVPSMPGTILSADIRFDEEFGTADVTEKTRTSKEYLTNEFRVEEDRFRLTYRRIFKNKREQRTAIANSTAYTQGEVSAKDADVAEDGTVQQAETKVKAQPAFAQSITVEENFRESLIETMNFNARDTENVPVFSGRGTLKAIAGLSLDDLGVWRYILRTRKSKDWDFDFVVYGSSGAEHHYLAGGQHNLSKLPCQTAPSDKTRIYIKSFVINDDNTYDWYAITSAEGDDSTSWLGAYLSRSIKRTKYRRIWDATAQAYVDQSRTFTYQLSMKHFTVAADAYAWLTVFSDSMYADVQIFGDNRYRAINIYLVSSGSWANET